MADINKIYKPDALGDCKSPLQLMTQNSHNWTYRGVVNIPLNIPGCDHSPDQQ